MRWKPACRPIKAGGHSEALLSSFTPEQLQLLKAALDGMTNVSGRSPFLPRQLHDLTLLPTKDDPRPTFFWSADKPRNVGDLTKTKPYPKLMWEVPTGREITVANAKDEAAHTAQGFILTPPANAEKPSPFDVLKDMLEGLTEADRSLVLKGAHATRLDGIKDGILELGDDEREALIAALLPAEKRKSA